MDWGTGVVDLTLRDLISELANWDRSIRRSKCVYIHTLRVVRGAVGSLRLAGIAYVLIECPLAVGNAIRFGCGLLGQLLLDLLVCLSFGNDVGQELEVLYAGNCVCCACVSGMIQV
jgi:hypothetical protein